MLRVLDLYSGTGSISRTLEKIYGDRVLVTSVDVDPKFNPTICADMLELDYKSLWAPGEFDAVWASPPCTWYSVARNEVPRDFELADKLVMRALEMIEYLRPARWFMENPRGHLRLRPFMQRYASSRRTVSYCKYSKEGDVYMYMKPTDIWSNYGGWEARVCGAASGRCEYVVGNKHPVTAQRGPSGKAGRRACGMRTSEGVYKVPEGLISDLFEGVETASVEVS